MQTENEPLTNVFRQYVLIGPAGMKFYGSAIRARSEYDMRVALGQNVALYDMRTIVVSEPQYLAPTILITEAEDDDADEAPGEDGWGDAQSW